jgi:hypothetical protein
MSLRATGSNNSKEFTMKIILFVMLLCLTGCTQSQTRQSAELNNPQPVASAKEIEPVNVNLCELLQSPEKYEQKLIRIKALYCYCFEDSKLYSSKCITEKSVWVQGSFEKCRNAGLVEDFQSQSKDEPAAKRWGGRTIGVVAVGRLIGTKGGYGHMNQYAYLFNIECLDRAVLFDLQGKRPAEMALEEQRRKAEEFENAN